MNQSLSLIRFLQGIFRLNLKKLFEIIIIFLIQSWYWCLNFFGFFFKSFFQFKFIRNYHWFIYLRIEALDLVTKRFIIILSRRIILWFYAFLSKSKCWFIFVLIGFILIFYWIFVTIWITLNCLKNYSRLLCGAISFIFQIIIAIIANHFSLRSWIYRTCNMV